MPTTTPVLMSLVWDKDTQRILGAQMMSKHDISETLSLISLCIQNQNTIVDIVHKTKLWYIKYKRMGESGI